MINEHAAISVVGLVRITDPATGELIGEIKNAIHPQNLALIIARGLSRDPSGSVFKMTFGNGGTFYNSSNQLVYRPPNTIGAADLYNPTYEVQVDEQEAGTPVTNSVVSAASPSPSITSVVTIIALLSASEPVGQAVADNITIDPEADFVFDEIGLKTEDDLLISHLIFAPYEKTANRAFLITYTFTISIS